MLNILHKDNVAQLTYIAQSDEANGECTAAINISLTNKKPTNLTFLECHEFPYATSLKLSIPCCYQTPTAFMHYSSVC
jgi:hypothetical protein